MGISYMMPTGPAHIPSGGGKSGINKQNFVSRIKGFRSDR